MVLRDHDLTAPTPKTVLLIDHRQINHEGLDRVFALQNDFAMMSAHSLEEVLGRSEHAPKPDIILLGGIRVGGEEVDPNVITRLRERFPLSKICMTTMDTEEAERRNLGIPVLDKGYRRDELFEFLRQVSPNPDKP